MASLFILVLFFLPSLMQVAPTPDFPVGLTLTYRSVDEYFMSGTLTDTETFEVVGWISPDNTSFMLEYTEGEGASPHREYRNVSYPYWDYIYYDFDLNETLEGSMYALWLDISDWESGLSVNISYGTYSNREYIVTSSETIEAGDVPVDCWVAEASYKGANDWDYTCVRHYDTQYGILIKSYVHRYAGADYYNNGEFTSTLISSNILDVLEYHPVLTSLDGLLIGGIIVETTVIIGYLVVKRRGQGQFDIMR